jgi:hypothetical protein
MLFLQHPIKCIKYHSGVIIYVKNEAHKKMRISFNILNYSEEKVSKTLQWVSNGSGTEVAELKGRSLIL